jgi:hypothetical protein
LKIRWVWVPAAVVSVVGALVRWGWLATFALVVAGLLLAAYANWRARRRKRAGER